MGNEFIRGETLMERVLIVAEGQTEERFIKMILIPYFQKKGIYNINVSILPNKILADSSRNKGGDISFKKVADYVKRLLGSNNFVTTLIDYYGIDKDFKGYKESLEIPSLDIKSKKELLETELKKEVNNDKFIPYIQMYEFEGLLFSNPDSFKYIEDDQNKIESIKKDIASYQTPEHINNSRITAPSKRLEKYYVGYEKTIDGINVAEDMGIEIIIKKCPMFKQWIEKIEEILEESKILL